MDKMIKQAIDEFNADDYSAAVKERRRSRKKERSSSGIFRLSISNLVAGAEQHRNKRMVQLRIYEILV